MASITLRSAVGRPLTNSEVDANFSALNLELGQKLVASLNLLDLPNPAQARSNLGLGNVENKSSATIRGELTSGNVTGALGYTPLSTGGGSLSGAVGSYRNDLERILETYNTSAGGLLQFYIEHSYGNVNLANARGAVLIQGHNAITAGNFSIYALPLSGGTLSGPLEIFTGGANGQYNEGLRLTAANNGWVGVTFGSTGLSGAPTNGWFAARNPSNQFVVSPGTSDGTVGLTLNSGGNSLWRNNILLHAGNYSNYALPLSGGSTSGSVRLGGGTSNPVGTGFSHTISGVSGNYRVVNFDSNGSAIPPSVWWTNGSRAYGAIDAQDPGLTFWANNGSAWQKQITLNFGTVNIDTVLQQGGNQVLHAGNYANYAISLSGATGISGYFKKSVSNVDVAVAGGTATPGSVQKDIFGWKLVADVGLDNQDGGTQYIDLKTNVITGSAMMYFKLEGYAYNYANVHSYHGLYMYTGALVLNRYTNNLAGSITFYDSYKAADGSLCLKINMGAVFYTSARARLYVQGHGDEFDWLQIVSVKRSNSTAAQF